MLCVIELTQRENYLNCSGFWMKKDFLEMWNVHGLDDKDIELINRTSNSLERYNRWMKYDVFNSTHPNLVKFAEGLLVEGKRQVQRIEDVRKGREIPAKPKGVSFPPIPDEYHEYRKYNKKNSKKVPAKKSKPARVNPKRKGKK